MSKLFCLECDGELKFDEIWCSFVCEFSGISHPCIWRWKTEEGWGFEFSDNNGNHNSKTPEEVLRKLKLRAFE